MGYLLGAGVGFIFDWAIRRKNPDDEIPIGMGDIKLLATGGLWIGLDGLAITLIVSCILGYLWGKRKKQRFIPFAPFFIIGAILALTPMAFLI